MDAIAGTSILVVDDEPSVQRALARLLERGGYSSIATAASADEARRLLGMIKFDVVLTDMEMPGGSGLELLTYIHEVMPLIATVMVTVTDSTELAAKALDLGAYGYIVKPFTKNEVLISVRNALRRQSLELENAEHRDRLQGLVKERTESLWTALQAVEQREQELRISHEDTIERLSVAAEFRDGETASHIKRMSSYCGLLSSWVGLDTERSEMVRIASAMHDVGKIGVPDRVLLKPDKLTLDEHELMKQHPGYGFQILSSPNSELLTLAATIALTHHERWDGSGYPKGLLQEEIPLEGRIAAVADVFDALITNRCYRRAFALPDAIRIMKDGRGSQFDPRILDVFLDHLPEILTVKKREEDAIAASLLDPKPDDQLFARASSM